MWRRLNTSHALSILFPALLPLALILSSPATMTAQDDEEWPPLSYLKSDYRRVVFVAHVRASQAEIVHTIGGYEDWRIVAEVVEPFKGKFRKGRTVTYYHGAEKGARKEMFLGEKIVFLERNFVEKEKRWVLAVLENSTLAYTADRVRKLRIIKRSMQKKKAPPKTKSNPS